MADDDDDIPEGFGGEDQPFVRMQFHTEENPLWPDLEEQEKNERIVEAGHLSVGVTPDGMGDGSPAITFRFDLTAQDGTPGPIVLGHTSVRIMLMMAGILRERLESLGCDELGNFKGHVGPKQSQVVH